MGQLQDLAHREGRTVFTRMVQDPRTEAVKSKAGVPLHVLMWAGNNAKIGGRMEKGRWKGMPIFSLTLEERATCPTSCPVWRKCYGDNMHMAIRFKAGWDLQGAIEVDLQYLDEAFPDGYLVRLHVLGDFYSVAYVRFWERMLREHQVRIYGYTHRQPNDPVGIAITEMALTHPDRCAMMRSDPVFPRDPLPAAVMVPHDTVDAPPGFVICPNEQGKTKSCGTCGLCMNGRNSIAFLDHSNAVIRARRAKV